MTPASEDSSESSTPTVGWKDGFLGILAGSGAGLCCVGPLLFGAVGLSGTAGLLASMPFVYHVILQWISLGIIVGAWSWFLYKWFQLPGKQRWNRVAVITSLLLIGVSVYVVRSWARHVLI